MYSVDINCSVVHVTNNYGSPWNKINSGELIRNQMGISNCPALHIHYTSSNQVWVQSHSSTNQSLIRLYKTNPSRAQSFCTYPTIINVQQTILLVWVVSISRHLEYILRKLVNTKLWSLMHKISKTTNWNKFYPQL